jgi:hypothetical protein
MKPKTQIALMLLSIAGLIISVILIELNGGVKNRIIYVPLALVAFSNLVSLVLGAITRANRRASP